MHSQPVLNLSLVFQIHGFAIATERMKAMGSA